MNLIKTSLVVIFILALLSPSEGFARAGGGGGGYSGGGYSGSGFSGSGNSGDIGAIPVGLLVVTSSLLIVPGALALIEVACFKRLLNKKNQEARELLSTLSEQDPTLSEEHIGKRISQIFFRVQLAWMKRNQDLVRDCVSDRLYWDHKRQTDLMIKYHEKNMLEKIELLEARVVEVKAVVDKVESAVKGRLKVCIRGRMIDYTINLLYRPIDGSDHDNVIKGNRQILETFTELWIFTLDRNDWVLDHIEQNLYWGKLKKFSSCLTVIS